jgi:hypothetical protein
VLKECLVFSSMRLGVPFIAPRQLGAVESNLGRQFLPSVAWRTGQSGAHRHCPVPPSSCWLGHVSHADRAADRWPGRPLAHRTDRCTPDSPVNYSRTSPTISRERPVRPSQSGAPDTVRCSRLGRVLTARAKTFPIGLFLFSALRHNALVSKTMY